MSDSPPPLSVLLSRWQELHDQGHETSAAELCRDHPECTEALKRYIALFRQLKTDRSKNGHDARTPCANFASGHPTAHFSMETPAEASTAPIDPPEAGLPQVPGYIIQGVLGRGGMGIVYEARDIALNRTVALKMMRGGPVASEELARFLAEAEAVAQLQHPGIVQVFGRGEHAGQPFFVMELCDGGSLAARLDGQPQPPRDAAALTAHLADAMHYAHTRGIVHRDLKPANVLLPTQHDLSNPSPSSDAEPLPDAEMSWMDSPSAISASSMNSHHGPKITDFGLAKWVERDSGLTKTVAVMGTPSYMAPEQAGGLSKQVGPAADIWSLGAILYECLTGQPPFRGETIRETMRQVETDDPVAPRQLQPRTPRDLEVICLKCLRKPPTQRYGSAAELGDDLRRFLAGQPIHARPVGPIERLWMWGRRHPIRATLAAVLALFVVVVPPLVLSYRSELNAAREVADERDRAARKDRAAALKDRYLGCFDRARQRQAAARPGWSWLALDDLGEAARMPIEGRDPMALRTVATEALGSVDLRPHAEFGVGMYSRAIAFSPDGRFLAIADALSQMQLFCRVEIFDLKTGKAVRNWTMPAFPILRKKERTRSDGTNQVAFTPDGRWLLAGMRSGQVFAWDFNAPTRPPIRWVAHKEMELIDLVVGLDSKHFFTAGNDGCVYRWSLDAPLRRQPPWKTPGPIRRLAVSPREGHVVAGTDKGAVFLDGESLREVIDAPLRPQLSQRQFGMTFDASGAMLLIGSDRQLHLYDVDARLLGHSFLDPDVEGGAHSQRLHDATMSPDGSLVASIGSQDGQLKVWEVTSGRVAANVFVGRAHAVTFSRDSKFLAVAQERKTVVFERRPRSTQRFALVQPRRIEAMAATLLEGHPSLLSLGVQPLPRLEVSALDIDFPPAEVRTHLDVWRYLCTAAALAENRAVGEALQADAPAIEGFAKEIGRLLDLLEGQVPRLTDRARLETIGRCICSARQLGEKSLDVSLTLHREGHGQPDIAGLRATIQRQGLVPLRRQLAAGKDTWWLNRKVVLRIRRPDLLQPGFVETTSAWLLAEALDRPARRLLWIGNDLTRPEHYALMPRPDGSAVIANVGLDRLLEIRLCPPAPARHIHTPRPRLLALDPPGKTLWTVDEDPGDLARSHTLVPILQAGPTWKNADPLFQRMPGLHSLAAGRRWLLAGGQDGGLRLLEPGREVRLDRTLSVDRLPLTAAVLSPDEKQAIVGTMSGRVVILGLPGGEVIQELPAQQGQIQALAMDNTQSLLATGSHEHSVELWNRHDSTWKRLFSLRLPSPVRQVQFSPDGALLLILLERERSVRVWNLKELRRELRAIDLDW